MGCLRRLFIALLLLLAVAAAAVYGLYRLREVAAAPFQGYSANEMFFTIEPGQSSTSIARSLEEQGIIRDRRLFRAALKYRRLEARLQAGEYRFAGPASTFDVIERLARGDVYFTTITIPEGLTTFEIAALMANKALGEEEELRSAFGSAELIAELDPDAMDLEGYLCPDTYRFPRKPSAADVARALVERFKSSFDDTRRARAAVRSLSVRQLVTLASIVEKETGQVAERPLIASVFANRLARGMLLQSDPTIIYELKRDGLFDGNLRRVDLERDSPYNTYRRAGLPPGPIASPGQAAIDAVLEPAESAYLYFVGRNDGTHHFSRTLTEHNAAVRQFQVRPRRSQ